MQDVKYNADRKRGDLKTVETKRILGEALIRVAGDYEDTHHNTDLMLVTPKGEIMRFPERWRIGDFSDPDFLNEFERQYKYEVTFRAHKNSGEDTEWQKMFGTGSSDIPYGDYDVYGWRDKDGTIKCWVVIDLYKFRDWWWSVKKDVKFEPSDYDKNCGTMKLHDEVVGYSKRVKQLYQNGETGFDYFYIFDWRKIPWIVVDCSENLKERGNQNER